MSAEEKQELLPKKDDVEVPSERPTVPVVDYTSKDFYDYLGLKKVASMETIKSTYAELSKKYNPVTNPDEIERYQDIYYSGKNLTNELVKKFSDDYGEISVLLYNLFYEYLPYETNSAYKYVTIGLIIAAFFLVALFCGVVTIQTRMSVFSYKWLYAFIPFLLITTMYLIYSILKTLQDLKKSKCEADKKDKKDKKDEKDKKENCECSGVFKNNISKIVLSGLLTLFQIILSTYLENGKKCYLILACLSYIAFEAIILTKKTLRFLKSVEAIKSGKEIDCPSFQDDIFLKYLIGKANAKCSKEDEKKKDCSSCLIGTLCYSIFYFDIYRIIQVILLGILFYKNPTSHQSLYLIPSFIILFAGIAEKMLKSKIGYISNTKESVINLIKLTIFGFVFINMIVIVITLAFGSFSIYSIVFPLLFELIVVAGFLFGFFPFVLILEYKTKHDELAVPY